MATSGGSAVSQVLSQVTASVWAYSLKILLLSLPAMAALWLLALFLWIRKKKRGKNRKK